MAATNVQAFPGDVEIAGAISKGGQVMYPQKRFEIDLTSDTTTARFYPIYLDSDLPTGLPQWWPINFKVIGVSLTDGDSFNEETLIGYARGGGSSDHRGMCKVHSRRYAGGELRFQGIWEGNDSSSSNGFVIYMRGGYKYSILTDAIYVVVNKAAYTYGNSVFAVKDAAGSDVVGTSANINQLQDINDFAQTGEITATTGNFILPTSQARLGIGTDKPAYMGLSIYTQDDIINMKSTRSENPEIKLGWSGSAAENMSLFEVDGNGSAFLYGRKYTTGTSANSNAGWKFYGNDNRVGIAIVGTTGNVGVGTAAPDHLFQVYNASNNNNAAIGIKAGGTNISGPHNTTFRQRAISATDRNLQIESHPYAGANRIAHWIHLNSAGNAWTDILSIRGDGRVGIGTSNPNYNFEVVSSYNRFGNIKFNSGFAAMPANASTGINMVGGNAGGGVLFVVSFHNGGGDSTGLKMCLLRKRNSSTWSQSSNNTHFISSLVAGPVQDGTLSFHVSSNILHYRYAQGGNSHFYVIDFDG